MLWVAIQFYEKAVNECALIARSYYGAPRCSSTPVCLRRDEKNTLILNTLRLGRPPPCFPPTVPPRPSLLPPTVHHTVEDVGADGRCYKYHGIWQRRQNKSRAATPSSPQSSTSRGRRLVIVWHKVDLVCLVTRSPSLVVRVMVHKTLPFRVQ